jgi:hypothetical protein
MGLTESTPLVTGGPAWATGIENSLLLIDSHDHTPGKGVLIPSAALDINADLSLQNNNLTNTKSVRFQALVASLVGTNLVQVVNGELYFVDGSGTPVQITAAGQVNVAGVGGITGMGGTTAAVSYSNLTKTFTFTQDAGKSADLVTGSVYITEPNVLSANTIGLLSPAGLAGAYDIELFSALPASTKIVQLNAAGNLLSTLDTDNVGIEINASLLRIRANGISNANLRQSPTRSIMGNPTGAPANVTDILATGDGQVLRQASGTLDFGQIATAGIENSAITTPKIADAAVENAKLAASVSNTTVIAAASLAFGVGAATSADLGTTSITVTGTRAVLVTVQSAPSQSGQILAASGAGVAGRLTVGLVTNGTLKTSTQIMDSIALTTEEATPSLTWLILPSMGYFSAGANTVAINLNRVSGAGSIDLTQMAVTVTEL